MSHSEIESVNELIDKLSKRNNFDVHCKDKICIYVMDHGFVLTYRQGETTFTLHYEDTTEAFEDPLKLLDRISHLIDYKRGHTKLRDINKEEDDE